MKNTLELMPIFKLSHLGIVRCVLAIASTYSIYYLLYDEHFTVYLLPSIVKLVFTLAMVISLMIWVTLPMVDIIKHFTKFASRDNGD